MEKVKSELYYIIKAIKIAPLISVLNILIKTILALYPSYLVIINSKLINSMNDYFSSGINKNFDIEIVLLFIAVLIINEVLKQLYYLLASNLKLKVIHSIDISLLGQQSKVDYKDYETEEVIDLYSRLSEKPGEDHYLAFQNTLNIMEYFVKVTSLLCIIFAYVWWASFIILLCSIPLILVAQKSGKADYSAFSEAQKHYRRANDLEDVLTEKEFVKERKSFQYQSFISDEWFKKFEQARKIEYNMTLKNFIKMKLSSILTLLVVALVAFVLLIPLQNTEISVGVYIAFINACFILVGQMTWQLSMVIRNHEKYKRLRIDFEEINLFSSEKKRKISLDVSKLSLSNLQFKYSDAKVLNGVNFDFHKGQIYGIVGENGAGKSTLAKILVGLYDTYTGSLSLNDVEMKKYEKVDYVSMIFQDFSRYQLTLEEYLLLDCKRKKDTNEILAQLGLEHLIEKQHLTLGKLKDDSMELSGGQWQKIAIAKSILSDKPILILDEPTSAIDPIIEKEIYQLVQKLARNKIVLLITHRLGAIKNVDEIILLENGKIKEKGNHDELMSLGGSYCSMYTRQRSWYYEKSLKTV